MADLFDNVIMCRECGTKMQKGHLVKNGFTIRAAFCKECNKKEYHPLDLSKYREFQEIKSKPFHVKLRLVGNSYSVSIPREILEFMQDSQEVHESHERMHAKIHARMKQEMEQMVEMMLEDANKIALFFGNSQDRLNADENTSHNQNQNNNHNQKQNGLNKRFTFRIK